MPLERGIEGFFDGRRYSMRSAMASGLPEAIVARSQSFAQVPLRSAGGANERATLADSVGDETAFPKICAFSRYFFNGRVVACSA